MAATVPLRRPMRSNRTPVWRVQPNPEGGRPTGLTVLGFEAAIEGVIVETDDAQALASGWRLVQHIGSVQAMVERRSFATNSISKHDESVLRECRAALSKLVAHMQERCDRLTSACIPEERRIAQVFDRELSMGCAP